MTAPLNVCKVNRGIARVLYLTAEISKVIVNTAFLTKTELAGLYSQ